MYVAFVDLKSAFDRVNWEMMLSKMRKIRIGGRKIIKEIYRETYNKVKTEEGLTE